MALARHFLPGQRAFRASQQTAGLTLITELPPQRLHQNHPARSDCGTGDALHRVTQLFENVTGFA
jgi:hypothetical protein